MTEKEVHLKQARAYLLFMFSIVKPKALHDCHDTVLYIKGNKILFEHKANGHFYVSYKIWSVLKQKYILSYQEISSLNKCVVGEYLKLKNITPISYPPNVDCTWNGMESEH